MMEVAESRSISRKPPVAMSCWCGRALRRMQVSRWLKLLSSAQPVTRGCWRQILLGTTLPILRTARLSAIGRMQKISARRFRGKDPRKSRPPAKVRRLNCLDLHHLSLSQELCQQARNRLWTRTLLCEPSCGVATLRLHRTSGPSLRPVFATQLKRIAEDREHISIIDRAAKLFHSQAGGIGNRIFDRIECRWSLNGRWFKRGKVASAGRLRVPAAFPAIWSGCPGYRGLPG